MKKIIVVSFLVIILISSVIGCSNKVDESLPQKMEENPPAVLANGDYKVDLQDIGDANGVVFIKFIFLEDNDVYKSGEVTSMPAAYDMQYILSSGAQAANKDDFLAALGDSKKCTITVKDSTIESIKQTE